jgi:putative ABC transport system ATP-binding protein
MDVVYKFLIRMDTIIDIKGLTKQYPMGNTGHALRDISISFAKGEFTGIICREVQAKPRFSTSLGRWMCSEGEVLLLGRSVGKLSPKEAADLRKKSLGFIFQTYNLLTVLYGL